MYKITASNLFNSLAFLSHYENWMHTFIESYFYDDVIVTSLNCYENDTRLPVFIK